MHEPPPSFPLTALEPFANRSRSRHLARRMKGVICFGPRLAAIISVSRSEALFSLYQLIPVIPFCAEI